MERQDSLVHTHKLVATDDTPPVLHYQCSVHANMDLQLHFLTLEILPVLPQMI